MSGYTRHLRVDFYFSNCDTYMYMYVGLHVHIYKKHVICISRPKSGTQTEQDKVCMVINKPCCYIILTTRLIIISGYKMGNN